MRSKEKTDFVRVLREDERLVGGREDGGLGSGTLRGLVNAWINGYMDVWMHGCMDVCINAGATIRN